MRLPLDCPPPSAGWTTYADVVVAGSTRWAQGGIAPAGPDAVHRRITLGTQLDHAARRRVLGRSRRHHDGSGRGLPVQCTPQRLALDMEEPTAAGAAR